MAPATVQVDLEGGLGIDPEAGCTYPAVTQMQLWRAAARSSSAGCLTSRRSWAGSMASRTWNYGTVADGRLPGGTSGSVDGSPSARG
jgi:hypothetical protein